jgi:hypothetical protein
MCGGCLKDTLSNLKKRHSRTIVTGQDPGNEIYMVSGNPKYLRNILAKHYYRNTFVIVEQEDALIGLQSAKSVYAILTPTVWIARMKNNVKMVKRSGTRGYVRRSLKRTRLFSLIQKWKT